MENLVADRVSPQLLPTIELMTLGDVTVLIAQVPLGSDHPYYVKRLDGHVIGSHQGTYVRLGSSDRQATPVTIDELRREASRIPFESLPARGAKMKDVDVETLSTMLARDVGEAELRTLGLITEKDGELVPTNAGVIVGSPYPPQLLGSAHVRCARFRGTERLDIFDRLEIESFPPSGGWAGGGVSGETRLSGGRVPAGQLATPRCLVSADSGHS